MFKQNTFYFEASKLTNKTTKIPVVCLLGWAGARDSNLRKYSKIYSDLGYHTIRFSPSFKLTFYESEQEHKKHAYEFLNLLVQLKLTDSQLLFHFFSNASGFIIYQHVLNELKKQDSLYEFVGRNQSGVIFDSTPGWPPSEFFQFSNSVYTLMPQKGVKEYTLAVLFVLFFKGYCFFQFGNDYYSKFFQTLLNDQRDNIPTLFVYSKIDKLVAFYNIEQFIKERKSKLPNLYIKSVSFDDAEHVMIYQKYPIDYLKLIKQHLSVCNLDLDDKLSSNLMSKL